MTKRYNVGIDVDGVLSNFTKSARELCKEMFGKPDDSLVQTGWSFESLGISKEEENQMWRKIDTIENWWMKHEVMPNTEYLSTLCENHRCIFITNRKDGTGLPIEIQTLAWIQLHYMISNPTIIISDDKGAIAKGLKLDYFIDDRPKNVEEVIKTYPSCQTVLLNASYNQECAAPRVYSFDTFANGVLTGFKFQQTEFNFGRCVK